MAKYQNLIVWQKSILLTKSIYTLVNSHAQLSKDYGLKDQICRSAVSIASNIAEGNERETTTEFIRFLIIARWSLAELQTQLIIAKEIGYIGDEGFENIFEISVEIQKMLNTLITSLRYKRRGD